MTLHCQGDAVVFILMNGREVSRPASYGYHYDPEGDDWPKCSILFGPYTKTRKRVEGTPYAKKYYGNDAPLYAMKVNAPPTALTEWTFVGDVKRIFYVRNGKSFPFLFQHRFKKKRLWGFGKKLPAHLYRRGKFYRLELPGDCNIGWRGIAYP